MVWLAIKTSIPGHGKAYWARARDPGRKTL